MKMFDIVPMATHPPSASVDRALLRSGVEQANIPALLMVVVQMTGDESWLEPPYLPEKGPGLDDNDSAGLDAARQAEVRAAAWAAIEAWLDGEPLRRPRPTTSDLARMLSVAMSEPVPDEYGQIIAPRLRDLADRESEPKVIHLLYPYWGIEAEGPATTHLADRSDTVSVIPSIKKSIR